MSPSAVMATPFTRTARWVTGPRVLPSGVSNLTTRQYIADAFPWVMYPPAVARRFASDTAPGVPGLDSN